MSGKERVGVIGLGLMGSALSGNLIQNGYEVSGFDIEPARMRELEERGGRAAASPAERRFPWLGGKPEDCRRAWWSQSARLCREKLLPAG